MSEENESFEIDDQGVESSEESMVDSKYTTNCSTNG